MGKLGAFIFGAIVGVGVGLLTAPKPGKEIREDALNLAKDYWGQTQGLRERVANVTDFKTPDFPRCDGDVQEKIDAARKIIADQVAKNAAVAHETLQKSVPIAAEKITNAAAAAHSAAENLAEKISPSGGEKQQAAQQVAQQGVAEVPVAQVKSPIDAALENAIYPE
jgi:gas vesicle protein